MRNIFAQSSYNEDANILRATGKLLGLLNIKVTAKTLRETLFSHPHYLSLLSITESLNHWKVDTTALKIREEELNEIATPFIAYLSSTRKFITVTEVSAEYIYYFGDKKNKQQYLRRDFIQVWNGVVLLAEPTEESGEPGYKAGFIKEWVQDLKIPVLLVIFLLAALLKASGAYFSFLLFCKLAGVIVSFLLLLQEYDTQNAFIKQICSVGKKVNCEAVLSSRYSKIGGWLSWSEVGFVYFLGSFLLLMISGTAALPFTYWLNIFSLPYIVFSLGYQAFKIRQWCILCLIVQILLLSEFLSAVFTYPAMPFPAPVTTADSLIVLFLSLFLPAFAWSFAKPFIYGAKARNALQYQLARFKNSADVFNAMLSKQPAVSGDTSGLGITIGDPNAENTLIKVCNPYCGPCAKSHPKIEALITNNPNWKVQIIFSARRSEDERKYITVSHLMAIAEKSEKENQEWLKVQALNDWYKPLKASTDKYQAFTIKYPLNGEIEQQEAKVHAMHEWCEKNAVTFTPTFFVNGHRLPEQYEVTDLQHL